jgi:hypothetical protein
VLWVGLAQAFTRQHFDQKREGKKKKEFFFWLFVVTPSQLDPEKSSGNKKETTAFH